VTAAQRLAALDDLPARDLIAFTEGTLSALVQTMNQETTLLRAGRHREAGALTAEKTRLAQEYVSYSRAVQRQLARLQVEAPNDIKLLTAGHERLATQIAENLKVIATVRSVTEDLLSDVAERLTRASHPKTYGASGELNGARAVAGGLSVNRGA
jgi:flagellar biosynthesis/type III secretory pathway chaperone